MSVKSPGVQSLSGGGISGILPAANGGTGLSVSAPTGTFTGTLTGMGSATTGTVTYRRTGSQVTLYLTATISGTSNTTAMTMTGAPAVVQPAQKQLIRCESLIDNGARRAGAAEIDIDGTITFFLDTVVGAQVQAQANTFTGSGTKGINVNWSMTYAV